MKPIFRVLSVFQLLLFSLLFSPSVLSVGVEFKKTDDSIEILSNKKRLLLYVFNTNQFKPYVKELYTLDGRNVLLDSPPDHLHHHGLMYAVTVDGINFWEESKNAGVEYPVKITDTSTHANDEREWAEFSQLIHWISPTNRSKATDEAAALLIEKRTIKLFVNKKTDEILLEWIGEFAVPLSVPKVILSGTDYHGLGVRFPRAFDKVARHFNQKNLPYQTAGKHDLIEAQWAAVSAVFENKPLTLCIITDNTVKGRSVFFSMTDPFAYLSATQGINKEPLIYHSGDKFSIRYLLILTAKELTPDDINTQMGKWLKN
ncbi:MAG: DUF6807 family protein [Verrucomicrobiia bacterium]